MELPYPPPLLTRLPVTSAFKCEPGTLKNSFTNFYNTYRDMNNDSFFIDNCDCMLVPCIIKHSDTRILFPNNRANVLIHVIFTDEWVKMEITKTLINRNLCCNIHE